MRMTYVHIRLPKPLHAALKDTAKLLDVPMTEVVRRALAGYLNTMREAADEAQPKGIENT